MGIESRPAEIDDLYPNDDNPCRIQFDIAEDIDETIFMYYKIENFQQNHRRYVKSRSNKQLLGNDLTVEELSDCEPIVTNAQVDKYFSINGTALDPDAPAFPCGLVAKSIFNDTFELYQTSMSVSNVEDDAEVVEDEELEERLLQDGDSLLDEMEGMYEMIDINKTDIAWESDVKYRFKNLEGEDKEMLQWADIEDGK